MDSNKKAGSQDTNWPITSLPDVMRVGENVAVMFIIDFIMWLQDVCFMCECCCCLTKSLYNVSISSPDGSNVTSLAIVTINVSFN